jgi:hypothetical protein
MGGSFVQDRLGKGSQEESEESFCFRFLLNGKLYTVLLHLSTKKRRPKKEGPEEE